MSFKSEQANIAKKEGVSSKSAGAILASATRKASPAARKANPKLNKVSGMPPMNESDRQGAIKRRMGNG